MTPENTGRVADTILIALAYALFAYALDVKAAALVASIHLFLAGTHFLGLRKR